MHVLTAGRRRVGNILELLRRQLLVLLAAEQASLSGVQTVRHLGQHGLARFPSFGTVGRKLVVQPQVQVGLARKELEPAPNKRALPFLDLGRCTIEAVVEGEQADLKSVAHPDSVQYSLNWIYLTP